MRVSGKLLTHFPAWHTIKWTLTWLSEGVRYTWYYLLNGNSLPSLKKSCRIYHLYPQISYLPQQGNEKTHLIQHSQLNYLVRHLNLSNSKQIFKDQDCCSKFAGYRGITVIRKRHEQCSELYRIQNSLLQLQWCTFPDGKIGISKRSWRMGLFIHASKLGLKAALLQNAKVKPSKSVAHSVAMNEK